MSRLTTVVEGWTGRLTFTLMTQAPDATSASAFVGTGFTLSDLIITGKDGTEVNTSGDFGWVTAASGTVYYDPDAADFVASKSPYSVRYKVTDGSGKIVFFPNADPDEILVKPLRRG